MAGIARGVSKEFGFCCALLLLVFLLLCREQKQLEQKVATPSLKVATPTFVIYAVSPRPLALTPRKPAQKDVYGSLSWIGLLSAYAYAYKNRVSGGGRHACFAAAAHTRRNVGA